jgi:hypothetical protein
MEGMEGMEGMDAMDEAIEDSSPKLDDSPNINTS